MSKQLSVDSGLAPGEPLWKRVPSRDANGRALFDVMLLIPGLSRATDIRRHQVFSDLQSVIEGFGEEVVFADLNLKTNLLWVSVRPRQGAALEFAAAVRAHIPDARLIASQADILAGELLRRKNSVRKNRWKLPFLR